MERPGNGTGMFISAVRGRLVTSGRHPSGTKVLDSDRYLPSSYGRRGWPSLRRRTHHLLGDQRNNERSNLRRSPHPDAVASPVRLARRRDAARRSPPRPGDDGAGVDRAAELDVDVNRDHDNDPGNDHDLDLDL